MLDGECRGELQELVPKVIVPTTYTDTKTRNQKCIRLERYGPSAYRVNQHIRSFSGRIPKIFSRLPQELLEQGIRNGWRGIMKEGQRILSN